MLPVTPTLRLLVLSSNWDGELTRARKAREADSGAWLGSVLEVDVGGSLGTANGAALRKRLRGAMGRRPAALRTAGGTRCDGRLSLSHT